MSTTDWNLLIGFTHEDAKNYLAEENVTYTLRYTAPSRQAEAAVYDSEEIRVIGVRPVDTAVELICAKIDWSVN